MIHKCGVCITMFSLFVISLSFGQIDNRINGHSDLRDIEFPLIINNDTLEQAKLTDFAGKIVILYYWNLWCKGCLESFPKLENLQAEFDDEIIILPVSFLHSKEVLRTFLQKREDAGKEIKMPLVVFENRQNDLFEIFPAVSYPHCIWINKDGVLINTTYGSEINRDNILAVMKGDRLKASTQSFQPDYDISKPFLTLGNGGNDTSFIFRTLITPFTEGISIGIHHNAINDGIRRRFLAQNVTIVELFKYSLNNGFPYDPFNQYVVLENTEKDHLIFDNNSGNNRVNWVKQNTFCYEIILPSKFTEEEMFSFMHQNLERYFRLKAKIEDRKTECYVLKTENGSKVLESKSETLYLDNREGDTRVITIKNRGLDVIKSALQLPNYPIILNEAGLDKNIDVHLRLEKEFDLDHINSQMSQYGLKLYKAKRRLKMLIIEEMD